jgi:hypothetical protein
VLSCEYRDCDVIVVGYSDGRIPWPIGRRKGTSARGLVVYGGLAEALRRESNLAVAHWWGVDYQTVSHWRKALGVEPKTAGTTRLRREYGKEEWFAKARRKAHRKLRDSERCRKIAEALRGRRRPAHIVEAARKAWKGQRHTPQARAKMRAAWKARGPRYDVSGRAWTEEQDAAVRTLSGAEAARRTGRTLSAVYLRRIKLGLSEGRLWTKQQDEAVRTLPAAEAARRTGRTLSAVYGRRVKLGLSDSRAWTKEEDEAVRALTPTEAVRRTGRTLSAVYGRRCKLGVGR